MHSSDSSGNMAIHSAVLRSQAGTLSVLLENGAEAEKANEEGWAPVHLASIMGNREIVALLLDHGVDVNARSSALYCKTALHYAALRGHCEVVELLIQRGAKLGMKDLVGMTAGEKAILAGQRAVVQMIFGEESERQIEMATVNLVWQVPAVRLEIGAIRRRITLLMALENWAVHFQS